MAKIYYDFESDFRQMEENDCWCSLIIGGRHTGKTYGALKYHYENKIPFVFIKRTAEDVKLICAGNGKIGSKPKEAIYTNPDFSPFKAINRDLNTNVQAFQVLDGVGGFWNCDSEGTPEGAPVGYIVALSMVSKVRGFDLSDCDSIIFDEFIPQSWERISHKEGDQFLDLYGTVQRDRELRGRKPLKMICLANAADISAPVLDTLECVDMIADMSAKHIEYYMHERGILIHLLETSEVMKEAEKKSPLFRAMGDTAWGRMAYGNEFAYNDFSNVRFDNMKNYLPVVAYKYKEKTVFIYRKDDKIFFTYSQNKQCRVYDLSREVEQKAFYFDHVIDIKEELIQDKVSFKSYSMYNLINNYTKIFNVR